MKIIFDITNNKVRYNNLKELEMIMLHLYLRDMIQIYKIKGLKGVEAIAHNYGRDKHGNPLYMIIVFNNNKKRTTVYKSKQSYNIKEDIKDYILAEFN